MVRLGQIIGRVLDAKTREPMEGIEMFFTQKHGVQWAMATLPSEFGAFSEVLFKANEGRPNKTGQDGSFILSGLPPGVRPACFAHKLPLASNLTTSRKPTRILKLFSGPAAYLPVRQYRQRLLPADF